MNYKLYRTLLLGVLLLAGAVAPAAEKTQKFAVKKGGTLELKADAGSITVRGWDKDEVSIRVQSISEEQLKNVTWSDDGTNVKVEFRWRENHAEEMLFDISLPSSYNVDLRTAGGDLTLEPPLVGNLKGSTAGGAIHLGNLGGTIRVETAGGDISSGDITGDLNASTAGGQITVKGVTGGAQLSTAGGEIKVDRVGKDLKVSTAGGDIALGTVGGELAASTAGGNINLQSAQGKVNLSTAGGNIGMISGKGMVHANTSAGNINLEAIEGAVSARTAAGDIRVSLVPGGQEASALSTSAGNISLRIPENAHATIHARVRTGFSGRGEPDQSMIRSDFPITYQKGRTGEAHGEISVNGGGLRINLETLIGKIEILKTK
jgi:DUF4097 and DUF4098 domain-containing protein YvlB